MTFKCNFVNSDNNNDNLEYEMQNIWDRMEGDLNMIISDRVQDHKIRSITSMIVMDLCGTWNMAAKDSFAYPKYYVVLISCIIAVSEGDQEYARCSYMQRNKRTKKIGVFHFSISRNAHSATGIRIVLPPVNMTILKIADEIRGVMIASYFDQNDE
ncbi:hypothetical protein Plhal304r1_c049g0131321 [Plasmopara halstedii]